MTKKHVKRMLAALLAALTLLSLAACGSTNAGNEKTDDPAAVQQTDGQKKPDAAKTDSKTDGTDKTGDAKTDTQTAGQTADGKQDAASTDEPKDDVKQEEPKQDINPATGKDQYETDPVPDGKPAPVEPEDTTVDNSKTHTCTISISCSTILNNMDKIDDEAIAAIVPSSGTILSTTTVTFSEGESVFDVLQRVCRDNGIHMEYSWTAMYNSAYIEGIANLYEFDVGSGSGWMYKVNGWFPNYGCSRYQVEDGDTICWVYTCNLGKDVGGYVG